jgi:hypothetical protein
MRGMVLYWSQLVDEIVHDSDTLSRSRTF